MHRDTNNLIYMLYHFSAWHFGISFKKLSKRFVDFGGILLVPSSVALGERGLMIGCHFEIPRIIVGTRRAQEADLRKMDTLKELALYVARQVLSQ